MSLSSRTIKDMGMLGMSQIFTSLGYLLLIPVITKSLGPYDFGIWAQISITVSLLTPLAVMGLSSGIVRFLSGEQDHQRIRDVFYSVLSLVFLSGIMISALLFFGSDILAEIFFGDMNASYYIKYGSLLVLLSAINQIALFYFRIFKVNTFISLNMFRSFGHLALTIALLHLGFGLLSVIVSLLAIESAIFIICIYLIISGIGFSLPAFRGTGEILRYSLPLTPNTIIKWVTDSSDRYMVTYFLGLGYVGIYSASYSIGNLINMITYPIQMVLFPELSRLYNLGKHNEVKDYLSYSLKYFLFLAIPAVVGLSVLSRQLLTIFTTPEFVSGSTVVPFIAVSGLLAGVFQILINIVFLVNKTKFNLYINIMAASLNIVLNLLMIPAFGITGAAIATLASYLVMVIISAHVSFKYIKPDIDWIFISKSVISSFVMGSFLLFTDFADILHLLIALFLGICMYLILTLLLKSFTEHEITAVKSAYNEVRIQIFSYLAR